MSWKRVGSFLRSAFLVVAITLAIDFVVTLFIPASLLDSFLRARIRDRHAYVDGLPWHHDYRPNVDMERIWGLQAYRFRTDAQAFPMGECGNDPVAPGKTVFVIGDSFVEGVGLPFEKTVAGLLACAWKGQGYSSRNLGVATYAPIIYHRKIAAAAQRLKVTPREIVVFLDICDISDETKYKEETAERLVLREGPVFGRAILTWLRHNFTTFGILNEIRLRIFLATAKPQDVVDHPCAQWTIDRKALEEWGNSGLASAARNLEKIVAQCRDWQCRMSLVVYPWPTQVAAGDRDSLQVRYWREWSQRNGVRFVDAFRPYFTLPADETIKRYYFPGDIHFNEAGNKLLFDEVWKVIGQP